MRGHGSEYSVPTPTETGSRCRFGGLEGTTLPLLSHRSHTHHRHHHRHHHHHLPHPLSHHPRLRRCPLWQWRSKSLRGVPLIRLGIFCPYGGMEPLSNLFPEYRLHLVARLPQFPGRLGPTKAWSHPCLHPSVSIQVPIHAVLLLLLLSIQTSGVPPFLPQPPPWLLWVFASLGQRCRPRSVPRVCGPKLR